MAPAPSRDSEAVSGQEVRFSVLGNQSEAEEGGVMDYHEERPDRGCLLGLALCCFFWAGALVLLAYLWGWL